MMSHMETQKSKNKCDIGSRRFYICLMSNRRLGVSKYSVHVSKYSVYVKNKACYIYRNQAESWK